MTTALHGAGASGAFGSTPPAARAPSGARGAVAVAAAVAVFLVAATVPYAWLVEHFGYDDILRSPTATVLAAFHAGGTPLVLAWLAFAMAALLFIPVALAVDRLLRAHGAGSGGASTLGIASAIVQCIGLLRWVLVVPGLAAAHADPATSPAAREAVRVVFEAVHHYGGMVVGEMVGQLLLAAWTLCVGAQLLRWRVVPRWLAGAGLATVPLWLLGQSELLHQVAPSVPLFEVVPLAFMAWEAWLAAMAVSVCLSSWRVHRRHPS